MSLLPTLQNLFIGPKAVCGKRNPKTPYVRKTLLNPEPQTTPRDLSDDENAVDVNKRDKREDSDSCDSDSCDSDSCDSREPLAECMEKLEREEKEEHAKLRLKLCIEKHKAKQKEGTSQNYAENASPDSSAASTCDEDASICSDDSNFSSSEQETRSADRKARKARNAN